MKAQMKAAAAILVMAAFAPAAFAQNMAVSATVTGTCQLTTINAMNFGTLDPILAPAVTGVTTTIDYRCTKGRSPTGISIGTETDGGYTGSMSGPLASTIPFGLAWSTTLPQGAGMGTGNGVSLTVTGSIAAGAYSDAAAGAYSASVPVVFTP